MKTLQLAHTFRGVIALTLFSVATANSHAYTTKWILEQPTYECVDGHITRMTQFSYDANDTTVRGYRIEDKEDGCTGRNSNEWPPGATQADKDAAMARRAQLEAEWRARMGYD